MLQGEAAPGLTDLEAATRLNPRLSSSGFALLSFGFCYLTLQRFDEAAKAFRQAAHMRQDNEFVRFGLIMALAHTKQIPEAKQQYSALNSGLVAYYSKLFRDPGHREVFRAGLALLNAAA